MADYRRGLGDAGEEAAAQVYEAAGYEVIDRNWRNKTGEIDLILSKKNQLVFCEVKTRRSLAFGHPAEAVTREKQQRLKRLAMGWLDENSHERFSLRLDVAAVLAHRDFAVTKMIGDALIDAFVTTTQERKSVKG